LDSFFIYISRVYAIYEGGKKMSDKKKPGLKEEKPDTDMDDMNMHGMEMPMMGGMCPMMSGCPMMQPMMCPMMYGQMMEMPDDEEQRMGMGYMRSPDWYDEDDFDESSDESDEYPGFWKKKKKYKYSPYPFFWPPFYPTKPYKKKHKKW
jgi:hypothetical protein